MNDRSIELSLRTWYPKDHPLHFDLHHPLGKLVGEWGELLDDYMKHLYKPEYEWEPLGELVDIWYYIRILAYQTKIKLEAHAITKARDIERIIANAIREASIAFDDLCWYKEEDISTVLYDISPFMLISNYSALVHICSLANMTIDQLTEASWQKLKPGSERGEEWVKAREFNRSEFEEE